MARRIRAGVPATVLTTTAEYLNTWLAGRRGLAEKTMRGYEDHIRLYLVPHLGKIPIQELGARHIEAMYAALEQRNAQIRKARASADPAVRATVNGVRPLSAASLQRLRATLRKALNDAIHKSKIRDTNPAIGIELASGKRPKARGVVAETVRTWQGALRSVHPQVSFTALGMRASEIVVGHRLDDALGETSPLGALYRFNGKVLLLGCGYMSNTSLHLAEWRQVSPRRAVTGSSIRQPDGTSQWTTWVDVVTDESDFDRLGADFDATDAVVVGHVGDATARLMSQRALVDFATAWMAANRGPRNSGSDEHVVSAEDPALHRPAL